MGLGSGVNFLYIFGGGGGPGNMETPLVTPLSPVFSQHDPPRPGILHLWSMDELQGVRKKEDVFFDFFPAT